MTGNSISHYAGIVRAELSGRPFARATGRLLWLLLHVGLAAAGTVIIAQGRIGWPLVVVVSLVMGNSFAVMAFVAHEALHGSILPEGAARSFVGWVGFLPLLVSPTHWVAWHNRAHHDDTMLSGVDPDAFPTVKQYRASALVRFGDHLTFGAGRLRGLLGLPVGFMAQSFSILLLVSRQRGYLAPQAFARAVVETVLGMAFWIAVLVIIGPSAFVFAFVIPVAIANTIVMMYVMSNHSLSPMTEINDPLLNSLTVTAPRLLEILHLGFGMHVGHHIFPAMSPRHARGVHRILQAKFPQRYQSLPLWRAVWRVFRTGHVYKDATTLIDPLTNREWPTLAPRD